MDFQNLKLNSKEDFRQLMLTLLNPLKPYYSEERARLQLGITRTHYDQNAAWMEAFSRPLWALVPFFAGGGKDPEFAEIYHKGLIAGTTEDGVEYWGECGDFDQRFVEMAAISYGILFAPELVWDPLTESEQDQLANYLLKINQHPLPVCNWILFAVLVNIALKKAGKEYSQEMLDRYLDGLETFYLKDGWYQDGDSGQKDYYVSFAIHFYSLVYAKVMEKEDPDRCIRYRQRAEEFGKQFIYWFDNTGEGLPFGRSLTYRFAQVSFFSACLMADVYPVSVEVMKGLIVRHLQSWLSKPIFDRDGILTIGYGYPNLIMAENYNASGSPYWGMKVFAFLMLPDKHSFWSVEAAPYPQLPALCSMPAADMLMYHYGNHTTAFTPGYYSPAGHGQSVAKYGKFAYDTRFGFNIAKSNYELAESTPDSMLAFLINGYVYVRRICEEREIRKDSVYSKWSPYPGIQVETVITPDAEGHTRVHRIYSEEECVAYDCGFAVNKGDITDVAYSAKEEGTLAVAQNEYSSCTVRSLTVEGKGEILYNAPNVNVLHPKTSIPAVKYEIPKGQTELQTRIDIRVN